jgi:hypothetical protein
MLESRATHRRWLLLAAALIAASAVGAGPALSATGPATTVPDASGTVWLCAPGAPDNPCEASLDTTIVTASGARIARHVSAGHTGFDCFYVYPTVTAQTTDNSDLTVEAAETGVARDQASPFSQDCRVFAPMYRQRTPSSLAKGLGGDPAADAVAYRSVLAAFDDYLENDNGGRPIVFVGHSQGAAVLIRLLAARVDTNPDLRARMVSAIIAGGNVTVPDGKAVGSSFQHIPACTSALETGCVIAYSSFPSQPPADSLFGIAGQGVSLQSGQIATTGVHVACVNPGALNGGSAAVTSSFLAVTSPTAPPAITTPWVTYPAEYESSCRQAGNATWLQLEKIVPATDARPTVAETLGANWGYHLDDMNLPMDDLVRDVRTQELAYSATHR